MSKYLDICILALNLKIFFYLYKCISWCHKHRCTWLFTTRNAFKELYAFYIKGFKYYIMNSDEHYKINGVKIKRKLGYIETHNYNYVPIIGTSMLKRRCNFQGYEINAMAEAWSPYISFDLKNATFNEFYGFYDVTYATQGMFY